MSEIRLPASGLAEDILAGYEEEQKQHFHLVTFNLGEEYGVPINQVQEIVRVAGITMVPNSPSYMEGVINLRGRVLPVLNLRKRLGLSPNEVTKDARIVVTEVGSKVSPRRRRSVGDSTLREAAGDLVPHGAAGGVARPAQPRLARSTGDACSRLGRQHSLKLPIIAT